MKIASYSLLVRCCAVGVFCVVLRIGNAQAADEAFETFGDVASYGVPIMAATVSLYKKDYEGLVQLGLTYGATYGVTTLLKETIDSTRPNGKPRAFPSGHTSRAFAGASYLHYRYGLQYGLPAYAVAAAVGYSRVESDKHHWHDVIGGAVIANVAAYIFAERYKSPIEVSTVIDTKEGQFGVSLYLRY